MPAYRLPGPTCGENQLLVADDGTSSRWPSPRPGPVNGAMPAHSSELDPYTLLQRARGVCSALAQARAFVSAAVYRETQCELTQLLDGLMPALMMAIGALGASALLGGAIGALVGALAGGVGAVPGAVVGAGAGLDIGVALLTWAGLAFLIEPVASSLGALSAQIGRATSLGWDAYGRPDADAELTEAARAYADAVAMLVRLILLAIVLRLTAGQAPLAAARAAGAMGRLGEGAAGASRATAEVVAQLRASRLGGGFADWVEAHSQELVDNPKLRPPRVGPTTSNAASSASTPSQLRERAAATPPPTPPASTPTPTPAPAPRSGRKPRQPRSSNTNIDHARTVRAADGSTTYFDRQGRGVTYGPEGYPDFGPYAEAEVKVQGLKGRFPPDDQIANAAVGLKETPDGYTWHHVEDGTTMQLVPTDLHATFPHSGGASLLRAGP